MDLTLFEVSWEVCNKVGGIHTVVSSKAATQVASLGERYVCLGPWLMETEQEERYFKSEPGFEAISEAVEPLGIGIRVGRWSIPGSPRTVLIDFSKLYSRKDEILTALWDSHRVDSLAGQWDYVEPVLFGWAAGVVIEAWVKHYVQPACGRSVAHFHEWMTGSGLLYLSHRAPAIGTVFTTHATVLGRCLMSRGIDPMDAPTDVDPGLLARQYDIAAKHSMEATTTRAADVFTTVSSITAEETTRFLGRAPRPLLPNGLDQEVISHLASAWTRDEARAQLLQLARATVGEVPEDALLIGTSGRYEFHNKGIDLLLSACAQLEGRLARPLVVFIFVPAGNAGVRPDVAQHMRDGTTRTSAPVIATHLLFAADEQDAVVGACLQQGLDNAADKQIRVVFLPEYLDGNDGLLDAQYEAAVQGLDLSCYVSAYEPWGYTPPESLALGVPTVTSDQAGFGRWCQERGIGPDQGVSVIKRHGSSWEDSNQALMTCLQDRLAAVAGGEVSTHTCQVTASHLAWSDLITHYDEAHRAALRSTRSRISDEDAFRLLPQGRRVRPALRARDFLRRVDVRARLPEPIHALTRLARNYWWSWDPDAPKLFDEIDSKVWREVKHDPVRMLRRVPTEALIARARDPEYVKRLEAVDQRFMAYMEEKVESLELPGGGVVSQRRPIVYLCFEYALHESLPIYSGGLGVLAGDHLKSASDLRLPFVAIGLCYRGGYVRQVLDPDGRQRSEENGFEPLDSPLLAVLDSNGRPITVALHLPGARVLLRVWRADVGRVPLYLLDADMPENRPEDRDITRRLYAGDSEARLLQELVLGKAGVRLLAALGLDPAVIHLNEGHAAFAALERASYLVRKEHLTFEEARTVVRSSTAFTTHTPVPAGHDVFEESLMRRYFAHSAKWLGLPWERFMALGSVPENGHQFNMTFAAARMSAFVNGVSQKHAEVSKQILNSCWPELLPEESPIRGITNGVHLGTWTSPEIGRLLGAEGRAVVPADYERAQGIDLAALHEARTAGKRRLLAEAARRIELGAVGRRMRPDVVRRLLGGLRDDALVLGFARRFAPYKRATLLLSDRERLARMLSDPDRPVILFVAGKAHPRDGAGLDLLAEMAHASWSDDLAGRLILLEDYDLELGRAFAQGVDVWLNTPIPPLEASGTSGMKISANGGLNCSTPDGWWLEAADEKNGWVVGDERPDTERTLRDALDSNHLYELIEHEIMPLFFDRDPDGLPRRWLEHCRHALESIPAFFSTDRMVTEYTQQAYGPLVRTSVDLSEEGFMRTREVTARQADVARRFEQVEIVDARMQELVDARAGDHMQVEATVALGGFEPDDLRVELVVGRPSLDGRELQSLEVALLQPIDEPHNGSARFALNHLLSSSGAHLCGVRVRPRLDPWKDGALRNLVQWAHDI